MKINFLLAIVALALGYVTCKNIQKTAEPAPSAIRQPESKGPVGFNGAYVIEGSNPDSAATVQVKSAPRWVDVPVDALPPASASRKAYLSTGWWNLNMAISPTDTTVHQHYMGKFMKFREDQTFDILQKGKVVDTGKWNWDLEQGEIYLSCHDPYINNTWNVTDKGYIMIWKGNTRLNVSGIQIRVAGTKTEPNWGN